ncbi:MULTISPECIES: DUF805 domain-containing protein [Pantoea]|uniref:Conserved inner membrane protein n=2 Tax=Pantoea stewartii TaxID=66269 RepID=H3RIG2_PANSE|nr:MULTISPECIES: DUF805 domain-containing protein [Pantoea]ARF48372.1 hypothetical protein DSJ_02650 [Pantoea stewartii subsp. stewartii DC283]EHT98924.1 conserved inner membrane protein [Pantoea stewartii subsp. stewartii DC283]KAB0553042.1 DUF805 domain-containing protein [Pantoea stewartii subsp. stewartii]KGD84807.1 membrane protein [Pantoea stewartii subsp. indologenes]KHD99942.1 membrane protein [Pantoea stewartii]
MIIQQWFFSFRGRVGRRDFWLWQAIWVLLTSLLFFLAGNDLLDTQMAAFGIVCLLWPASAIVVKRLHDRDRRGYWALLLIAAWLLMAGNWSMTGEVLQWLIGRVLPFIILAGLILDLGVFRGTVGDNRFGAAPVPLRLKRAPYQ